MEIEKLHTVYIGLGANLGDRASNIHQAIRLIGDRVGNVCRQSSLYESAPWGFCSENRFLNAVVCCQTCLSPHQLLATTQGIERELGRTEKTCLSEGKQPVYHDRLIDIDILIYDDLTIDEPGLKIPHPLMRQRDFVMVPLKEISDNY